ncbi:MAG: hypothetical protein WC924_02270 [Candidatus Gracilibacteria bacterium]
MKKLPVRLGKIFLAIDLVFWIILLFSSLISPENAADAFVFGPTFWYLPASLILTSIPLPFLTNISLTVSLILLALIGSLQHFIFGYLLGLIIDSFKKKARG